MALLKYFKLTISIYLRTPVAGHQLVELLILLLQLVLRLLQQPQSVERLQILQPLVVIAGEATASAATTIAAALANNATATAVPVGTVGRSTSSLLVKRVQTRRRRRRRRLLRLAVMGGAVRATSIRAVVVTILLLLLLLADGEITDHVQNVGAIEIGQQAGIVVGR